MSFSLQRDPQTTQDSLNSGKKSTALRFKVSMLMTVLLHRHHPSSWYRNQQSVICHQPGVTPSRSYKRKNTMPKTASKLAAAPSTRQARISKTQVAVHNFSFPTTSFTTGKYRSYSDRPWLWRTQKERSRGKYDWQMASTNRIQKMEIELQKRILSFFAISQSRYAMDWWSWGCWKYWRAHCFGIYNRKTNTGLRESWFQDSNRTQENYNRRLRETSHRSRRRSSVREKISYRQRDCFDDPRLLQKKWRQWSHLGFKTFISKVKLENDNVQDFDTKWDEVWSAVTDRRIDSILESLYQIRVH